LKQFMRGRFWRVVAPDMSEDDCLEKREICKV